MTTALDSSLFEFFEFWIWTNHNSLLSIATNQLASFFIDTRSRQCYFRVCQSGEISNKRAFFSCIFIFFISDTLGCASCATFLFLPHFDVIFDLLLNRRTATWNLFVKLFFVFILIWKSSFWKAHARLPNTYRFTYHLEGITGTLWYIYLDVIVIWNWTEWMKGICHVWSRGRHFSPSLPGDRYLNLGSKSDHRAEISGNIVRYDALAPRPEVLH